MTSSRAFYPKSGTSSGTFAAGNDTRFASAASIPADRGYLAWTMPPWAAAAAAAPSAGTLSLARIYRVPAGSVTNIVMASVGAGSGLTTGQCFAALYTAAGVLVAQTADQSTAWAASGVKTMALAAGPYTVAAGDYYVGIWHNGTTGPTWTRYANSSGSVTPTNVGLSAPNLAAATANTGLTTTAPGTLGTQTSFLSYWWAALS